MAYSPKNPNGQATMANSEPVVLASDQTSIPVSATLVAGGDVDILTIAAGDNNIGNVDIVTMPNVTLNALPAGTNNIGDVDVLTVPADPFGVNADAASATGSISAKLRFIASTGIPITGSVTVSSHNVTNAGTFATQIDGAALTSLQLIDDTVVVLGTDIYTEATSKGIIIGGVRRDADTTLVNTTNEFSPFQLDANGRLKVEAFSGEALPVTLTSTTITGTVAVTDNAGSLTVDAPVSTPVFTRLSDGAAALIGQKAMAASLPVTLASDQGSVSTTPAGNVAHDAVDSGAPVKVGAKAASSLATATMVAAADRTDNVSDLDGSLITRVNFPLGDLKSDAVSNTDGASTASTVFTAVASTRNFITGITVFRTDAGTTPIYIDFRDGTAGAVLWRMVLPPNGGSIMANSGVPIFRTTANTALAYDVSAATTTVYINVSGFASKL